MRRVAHSPAWHATVIALFTVAIFASAMMLGIDGGC
jgi:hypothetical protein